MLGPFPLSVTRRRLLALGGAAAACLPLTGLARSAGAGPAEHGLLRVGYVPGSGAWPGLEGWYRPGVHEDGAASLSLVPATAAACDSRSDTWSMAFHGLNTAPRGAVLRSLCVEVLYRVGGRQLPYCVWSGRFGGSDVMHPVKFPVGADAFGGLAFQARLPGRQGLRAMLGGSGGAQYCRPGGVAGGIQPAAGLYVIAGPDDRGEPADWRSLRLRAGGADDGVAGFSLADTAGRAANRDWMAFTLIPA